jgi:3'-phosphoadenosine 5'-phosphosulfate sulfotransferase (PAPS reductase)/FAD synthetase
MTILKRIVSISGGADSTALAILLWQKGIEFDLLFADTGAEFPETYQTISKLAQYIGRKLYVVSGGGMFSKLVSQGYFLPSNRARWCTRELKLKPMEQFYRIKGVQVNFIGIRYEESHRLETIKSEGECKNYYPLVYWKLTKKDVMGICKKHDLLNPIYQWRSSCSCFCCFNQKKWDWKNMAKYHKELFMLAENWEEMSLFNSQNFGWNERFKLKDIRHASETQMNLFPEIEIEPCLICSI